MGISYKFAPLVIVIHYFVNIWVGCRSILIRDREGVYTAHLLGQTTEVQQSIERHLRGSSFDFIKYKRIKARFHEIGDKNRCFFGTM